MECKCNGGHDHHEHNDGCGCNDHHHQEDIKTINLTLEDGSELKCEVVVILEIEDKEYMGVLPEGGEQVFLYAYVETEEGPELSIIEDDDEFDKVAEAYEKMMEEVEEEE